MATAIMSLACFKHPRDVQPGWSHGILLLHRLACVGVDTSVVCMLAGDKTSTIVFVAARAAYTGVASMNSQSILSGGAPKKSANASRMNPRTSPSFVQIIVAILSPLVPGMPSVATGIVPSASKTGLFLPSRNMWPTHVGVPGTGLATAFTEMYLPLTGTDL